VRGGIFFFTHRETAMGEAISALRAWVLGPQGDVLSFAVVSGQTKEEPALRVLGDSAVNVCP